MEVQSSFGPGAGEPRSLRHAFGRLVRVLLILLGGLYLFMLIALAYMENSLVYPGSKYPRGNWAARQSGYTEIEFSSEDGTKLFGWYLPYDSSIGSPNENQAGGLNSARSEKSIAGSENPPAAAFRPRTILHCHGNGENISQVGAHSAKQFSQTLRGNIFTFDYRGFGKSEGSPNETGVLQDAEAALEWVCEKDGVKPADVILVGHSLGGGPACYLAKKHGCRALILQRTFSSLPEAAAKQYPMFPVGLIMRNRMDSATAIKSCSMPLFQSHGDQDTLIPIELGRKVFDRSPAKTKKFFAVKGMGHFDPLPRNYWPELKAFIDSAIEDEPSEPAVSRNSAAENGGL